MASHNSTKTDSGGLSPEMRSPHGDSAAARDGLFFQLFEVSPVPAVVTRVHDHTVLAVNARTSCERARRIAALPSASAIALTRVR